MNNVDILTYYTTTHDKIYLAIINAIMGKNYKGKATYDLRNENERIKFEIWMNKHNLN
jgi:hypothetical protein